MKDNKNEFFKNVALSRNLTGNQMRFIFLLLGFDELTQSEMIELTGWKRQTISKLSIDLVELGLVTKKVKHNLNFYSVNFDYVKK